MSQQLAIIVLVDVVAALKARSLKDHTYLFDNMKHHGSEGEGTPDLVTAVNGAHWADGSQADEQVLNWLPYSMGAVPPTVPRTFQTDRTRASDQEALDALAELRALARTPGADLGGALVGVERRLGTRTRVKSHTRGGAIPAAHKLIDMRGEVVYTDSHDGVPALNNPTPLITDITGEAVDKKIIYPAQYGSPDMVTDGWYWSASVDTSRPGTYRYKMEIHLRELIWRNGWVWEPVRMTFESRLRVTSGRKRNAFTGAGAGLLPIA